VLRRSQIAPLLSFNSPHSGLHTLLVEESSFFFFVRIPRFCPFCFSTWFASLCFYSGFSGNGRLRPPPFGHDVFPSFEPFLPISIPVWYCSWRGSSPSWVPISFGFSPKQLNTPFFTVLRNGLVVFLWVQVLCPVRSDGPPTVTPPFSEILPPFSTQAAHHLLHVSFFPLRPIL